MGSLGYKEQSSQIVQKKFLHSVLGDPVGAHEGTRIEKIEVIMRENKMVSIHNLKMERRKVHRNRCGHPFEHHTGS